MVGSLKQDTSLRSEIKDFLKITHSDSVLYCYNKLIFKIITSAFPVQHNYEHQCVLNVLAVITMILVIQLNLVNWTTSGRDFLGPNNRLVQ